jgi:hypothetical protein
MVKFLAALVIKVKSEIAKLEAEAKAAGKAEVGKLLGDLKSEESKALTAVRLELASLKAAVKAELVKVEASASADVKALAARIFAKL